MTGTQVYGKELLTIQSANSTVNLLQLRGPRSIRLFDVYPLVEDFNEKHGTRVKVLSYGAADFVLSLNQKISYIGGFATDLSIACERPNTPLGKEIVYTNKGEATVILETGRYEGQSNVALVSQDLTAGDFAYTIGKKQRTLRELLQDIGLQSLLSIPREHISEVRLLIPDSKLIVVPKFPGTEAHYGLHGETSIPFGNCTMKNSDSRFLFRLHESSHVSLAVRNVFSYSQEHVDITRFMSDRFAVMVEVPEIDILKIQEFLASNKSTP